MRANDQTSSGFKAQEDFLEDFFLEIQGKIGQHKVTAEDEMKLRIGLYVPDVLLQEFDPFPELFLEAEEPICPGKGPGSDVGRQISDAAGRIASTPGPVEQCLINFSCEDFERQFLRVDF